MRIIAQPFLIILAISFIAGCKSTSYQFSTSDHVPSSVPGLTHYYQDRVNSISAPDPISGEQLKAMGLFVSDEKITAVGGNPYRFRNLLLEMVDTLPYDWDPQIKIKKDPKFRYAGSTVLFKTEGYNKQLKSAFYHYFSKFCLQNNGIVINEKTTSPYNRKSGINKIHHICKINNTFHSAINIAFNDAGEYATYEFTSKARTVTYRANSKQIKNSENHGGWFLTNDNQLIQYNKMLSFKLLEYQNSSLSFIDNIVLLGGQEALFSYRDEVDSLPLYDRLFHSNSKYKYGNFFIEYAKEYNSSSRYILSPPNTSMVSGAHSIRFSIIDDDGTFFEESYGLDGTANSVSMLFPNPPGKTLDKNDVLKIMANTQKHLFSKIRTKKEATQFVTLFNKFDILDLTKKAYNQIDGNIKQEQLIALEQAQTLEQMQSLIDELEMFDPGSLLLQAKQKKHGIEAQLETNHFENAHSIYALNQFISKYSNNDPANLIRKAKKKLKNLNIHQQQADFDRAYSSNEWSQFISTYENNDVAKLLDNARQNFKLATKREKEEERQKIASLNKWRASLSVGDDTFCGRVIERRNDMVKIAVRVQLAGYSNEQWLHSSEVHESHKGCINRNGKLSPQY
tara:strand:+ start:6839 stop:8707 length:1869 start_codon:yes stop_codon:yes gene_type:complete